MDARRLNQVVARCVLPILLTSCLPVTEGKKSVVAQRTYVLRRADTDACETVGRADLEDGHLRVAAWQDCLSEPGLQRATDTLTRHDRKWHPDTNGAFLNGLMWVLGSASLVVAVADANPGTNSEGKKKPSLTPAATVAGAALIGFATYNTVRVSGSQYTWESIRLSPEPDGPPRRTVRPVTGATVTLAKGSASFDT